VNPIADKLALALFNQRESNISHLPYDHELSFYDAVKMGDTDAVKTLMLPLTNTGLGHLSDDPLRNLKYHFIITVALLTRFCIEGGLDAEIAYTISDLYIQRVDTCKSCDAVTQLHQEVVFNLTERMHDLQYRNVFPKNIVKCMDYINSHLHTKISSADLAKVANLHPNYLSSYFKRITGMTLTRFILLQRINVAKNMLKYSDYTCLDIGNYLVFSSHSHFIHAFKKEVGQTPQAYRNKHFRHNWDDQ